ncbi:MAG TPA: nicotinate-nucleotide adenylyltransferase [Hyphomicrobiales bacterium]|nr:nicotinate-nucleotide adenylyltransferase [Hyphomicrobiales bacterium]
MSPPVVPVFPPHGAGQRIGLLGGSFNPPHAGHRHVSLIALDRLRLDAVWWLVTPGNPLKPMAGLPPLDARIAAARKIARHPRIAVTGIEAALGTRYTVDTLAALRRRAPEARFVWLMGADNLAQLDRWRDWPRLARLAPFAVIDRPGATLRATRGRAATALAPWRVAESAAPILADLDPPAWCFLHAPRSDLSSTLLRTGNHPTAVPPKGA